MFNELRRTRNQRSSHVSGASTPPEALPDWVGEPEGDVDYRELLQNAGVDVPTVDDSDSMDDVADGDVDDNSTMEGQDVQVGTPVQGSTVGDIDPKSPAVIDTQEQTQVHTHSHQQQHPSTHPSAGASTGSSTAPPTRERYLQRNNRRSARAIRGVHEVYNRLVEWVLMLTCARQLIVYPDVVSG